MFENLLSFLRWMEISDHLTTTDHGIGLPGNPVCGNAYSLFHDKIGFPENINPA